MRGPSLALAHPCPVTRAVRCSTKAGLSQPPPARNFHEHIHRGVVTFILPLRAEDGVVVGFASAMLACLLGVDIGEKGHAWLFERHAHGLGVGVSTGSRPSGVGVGGGRQKERVSGTLLITVKTPFSRLSTEFSVTISNQVLPGLRGII